MNIEEDTHDQLVKAYLDYFKANEVFVQKPSEAKRVRVRKCLTKIHQLAKLRKLEVLKIHGQVLDQYRETGAYQKGNKYSNMKKKD